MIPPAPRGCNSSPTKRRPACMTSPIGACGMPRGSQERMAAMDRQYDLVVIGTGVTSAVASRCREAGWSVAVVDSRPVGGTCALRGCVPKKILVGAAEAVHAARDLADTGVPARQLTIDWPSLMRFKRSLVDPTPERTEQAWRKMGVELFPGRARFVGPTTLAVGADRLTGRRVLIAAG